MSPTSSPLHTPLCDLLGIRYPIIQAPMAGGWTTPELVSEVSNAGGLGMLAGARVSPDQLREDIRAVKSRTDRPFGVNFLIAPPEPGNEDVAAAQRLLNCFRKELGLPPGKIDLAPQPSSLLEQLKVPFEERVPVPSFALGDPGGLIDEAHAVGAHVTSMVTTVEEAVRVADGGADVVVVQGAEAGGHRSTFDLNPDADEPPLVGTLALVPQVVDAVGAYWLSQRAGSWTGVASLRCSRSGRSGCRSAPAFFSRARVAPFPPTRSVCLWLRRPIP